MGTDDPGVVSRVRAVILNPAFEVVEGGTEVRLYPAGKASHSEGTGTSILVRWDAEGVPVELLLDRPVYCNDQLFVVVRSHAVFVSDFFGAALEWLPAPERGLAGPHLIDFLLFRTVPGTGTLVTGVRRLGHGEIATWQRGKGWSSTTRQFPDVDEERATRVDVAGSLRHLDRALRVATRSLSGDANLFSGGVDSTLLQHYLGPRTEVVTVLVDSPELRPEARYARRSRELLGARGREVRYRESEYRDRLEATIRTLRLPPHHLQTVSIGAGYSTGHERYHTAQFADALFGLGFASHAQRAWYLRGARHFRFMSAMLPGTAGRRFATLQRTLVALGRPATALDSFAQSFAVYSDLATMRAVFGPSQVAERLRARSDYTRARLSTTVDVDRPGLASNLELGHWIDLLCDDTVALWGQLALGHGTRLIAPFTHPRVVEAAVRIPSPDRFARRGRAKFWLKRLLRNAVPDYPVEQTKYSSGLPFWRYYDNGPLRHALRDYERPSFLPEPVWRELDDRPTWLTWNVLTYLIWDRAVRGAKERTAHADAALDWHLSHG